MANGIHIGDGNKGVIISNNYIKPSRYGVYFCLASQYCKVVLNRIEYASIGVGCFGHSGGKGEYWNLIAENTIYGATYTSIYGHGQGEGTGRVIITENIILDSGYNQTKGHHPCIRLDNLQDAIIMGNMLMKTGEGTVKTSRGIWIAKGASRCLIANNYVVLPGETGIFVDGGELTEVIGNIVHSCKWGIATAGSKHLISNNIVDGNQNQGLWIKSRNGSITGNIVFDNSKGWDKGYGGIELLNADNNNIQHNTVRYGDSPSQGYGIKVDSDSENNLIANNDVADGGNKGRKYWIYNEGTGNKIKDNKGFITENSGTTTIAAGNTSVDVSHGLSDTPTGVQLTPTTDTVGKRYWVSERDSTTFNITIDSSHTSDISFDWKAAVGEGN